MHRPIKGTPKTAIVKRTPTGKWFVSISVEIGEEEAGGKRLPACTAEVGIDVGLSTFASLSTGEAIANPRFFRREEAALARNTSHLSTNPCRAMMLTSGSPLARVEPEDRAERQNRESDRLGQTGRARAHRAS